MSDTTILEERAQVALTIAVAAIRDAIQEAVLLEREECAQVMAQHDFVVSTPARLANLIRNRKA